MQLHSSGLAQMRIVSCTLGAVSCGARDVGPHRCWAGVLLSDLFLFFLVLAWRLGLGVLYVR